MSPGPAACSHPLDDEVVQTFSIVRRDLVEGLECRAVGYYCQRHRRFGRWETEEEIPVTAADALAAAFGEGRP